MFSVASLKTERRAVLFDAVRQCRTHLLAAAGFSALVNLLYLTPTLFMMQVYDRVVPTAGLDTLILISMMAVAALSTLATLDWLRSRLLARAGLIIERSLSRPLILRRLGAGTSGTGNLRDVDAVKAALSGQGVLALLDAPWTPIYLVCAFLLHWSVGILTLVGGGLLVGLAWLNEQETRSRINQNHQASTAAYLSFDEIAGHAEVIRALGMQRVIADQHTARRESVVDEQFNTLLIGGRYSAIVKYVRLVLQSAALGLAAFLVIKGSMTAGSIIAASILLSRSVQPIEQLVGTWPALAQARSSWMQLIAAFDQTPDPEQVRTHLPTPIARLRAEGLVVRLGPVAAPQLRGVSLHLEPGQVLGIMGPSGSGKTTLARILAGAISPTAGVVRLDDADYAAWSGDALAQHIGYLPQSPTLFAGSVRDNIARFQSGDPQTVDIAVIEAAKAAGAHAMILRLPEGYDTALGVNGGGLSAGQAQRIALARALYGKPALLVLDEPNSNLDQEGEAALMAAMLQASARKAAVVIIAHRVNALNRVDRLAVLRDGRLQMDGPRAEILAKMHGALPSPTTSSIAKTATISA